MINKILDCLRCKSGVVYSNDEDLDSDKYISTKKWEWSYLRVRNLIKMRAFNEDINWCFHL
jgi:ERCC4-related helicase